MADAMEIIPNDVIPTLPPLPDVAPLVHMPGAGDGQNWPSETEGSSSFDDDNDDLMTTT